MSLATRCVDYFAKSLRVQGERLWSKDDYEVVGSETDFFLAEIAGVDEVQIDLETKKKGCVLHISCTCSFSTAKNLCKHMWTAIMAADGQGWGKGATSRGDLSVQWMAAIGDPDDEELWEEEDAIEVERNEPKRTAPKRMPSPVAALQREPLKPVPTDWKKVFLNRPTPVAPNYVVASELPGHVRLRDIRYALNVKESVRTDLLTIDLFQREQRANGEWGVVKPLAIDHADIARISSEDDRRLLAVMLGGKREQSPYNYYMPTKLGRFQIASSLTEFVLPLLAQTGRFYLFGPHESQPIDKLLTVDNEGPADFELAVVSHPQEAADWLLQAQLRRGDDVMVLRANDALIDGRLAVVDERLIAVTPLPTGQGSWLSQLVDAAGVRISRHELHRFVETLLELPSVPRLVLPADAGWKTAVGVPSARLSVLAAGPQTRQGVLFARVFFDYDGRHMRLSDARRSWASETDQTMWQRDAAAESQCLEPLLGHSGVGKWTASAAMDADVYLPATSLATLTGDLTAAGWHVEAEGRRLRVANEFKAFIASGVDWFDLEGSCNFGQHIVTMPSLLKALKDGQVSIRLGDGTDGLLPADWLRKFANIAELGSQSKDRIRFTTPQAVLLDAMLEDLPEVRLDARFCQLRERIKSFAGVKARDPGPQFCGKLRDYQREGLGWLEFLADFGFGGCLADDMGLGKTVQVLAMLQDRQLAWPKTKPKPPSLIVLPRSLVHNWQSEAQRFAPTLRILDLSTPQRHSRWSAIGRYDLVLTTYAILRSDIEQLSKVRFDYCILDEAQAIKNDTAQVSKAARLLQANHRLAMSGTPVENHLGELGSIFAFLNPGMLSPGLLRGLVSKTPDTANETVKLLAKALRPFILRRTKDQVLKDLPAKTEQTIYCDLDRAQRKMYNDLRDHYRARLTKTIAAKGVSKSQIEVLEALLRLRQAACHPALIDKSLEKKSSAKLEALLEQLHDVIGSGHKALVFSQFTSMLAIVKKRLDQQSIPYEYLDGSTRDRQAHVARFQSDPLVPVFLISLKAGGVGLNLTAAEYCFILDPWWNPAAEAQAIDRAHRIGQTKRVFAYRLIARDTVEEKILALQDKKRDLASTIVSVNNSHVRGLSLDDVELLLS